MCDVRVTAMLEYIEVLRNMLLRASAVMEN